MLSAETSDAFQKGVSRHARSILDRSLLRPRECRDVGAFDDRLQTQAAGQRDTERLVSIRVGASQLVVQVRDRGDRQGPFLFEFPQDEEQGHRVGAAGERHEYARLRPRHVMTPNRVQRAASKRGRHLGIWKSGNLGIWEFGNLEIWGIGNPGSGFQISRFPDSQISRFPDFQISRFPDFQIKNWCRCRDLNPGLRGYEPRALTN
jgi:hypothetical protein